MWNENIIKCLSLSKCGLPAVRTGIIIAREEIIQAITSINAIMTLAPGSFGAMLTNDLIKSGKLIELGREVINPFYRKKVEKALDHLKKTLSSVPYRVHVPEGSMFLWLWFENLPISSQELYQRLKRRGVLVVSGHYFFPGLKEKWRHTHECIRLTYSQNDDDVARGIELIGEEIKEIYRSR